MATLRRATLALALLAGLALMLSLASGARATDRISRLTGANGRVTAISEPDTDGTRYLGGSFTAFDAWDTGNGAAIGATSGEVNAAFPKVAGGLVLASAPDGSGGFYIGGSFTSVDGVSRASAAHINADGSLDRTWAPDPNGQVAAIAVSGSTVYLGGYFTTVGGTTRNRVAAVGTDGTLASWNPNANGQVAAIAVSGSTVYLGGSFTNVGGTPRNYAAAVGTDGTLTSWDPNLNECASAIAVSGSTVYLGGYFTTVGGTARNRAAAVGTDGTLTSWNPNLNSSASAIAVSGSTVYLGGGFGYVGGTARNYAAAVGTDGTLTSWDPNLSASASAIAVSGSNVYLGGGFTTVGGAPTSCVAAVGADGQLTSPRWARAVFPPAAPTNLIATPGDTSASIAFTAGADGGSTITNYEYSTDNGGSWTAFSPLTTTSPVSISGLTNGTTYQVKLRAINGAGTGADSSAVSVRPETVPAAPTNLIATPGDTSASIAFTAGADGGSTITNYEYSTDNGGSWTAFSPLTTTSPVSISGLTNGTTYQVKLRAINGVGTGADSSAVSVTPVAPSTPVAPPTPLAPSPSAPGPSAGTNSVPGNSVAVLAQRAPRQQGDMLITTGGVPDGATSVVQIATGGSAQMSLPQMALRPRATVRVATNCPIATKGVERTYTCKARLPAGTWTLTTQARAGSTVVAQMVARARMKATKRVAVTG